MRGIVIAAAAWLASVALAQAKPLAELLAQAPPSQIIHLVFVHGIRTDARGASLDLQAAMCRQHRIDCPTLVRVSSDRLDITQDGDQDSQHRRIWRIEGRRIWRNEDEWRASEPVVDHYVYDLGGRTLVVDEVNWWPFALSVKCRFLVQDEANLIGYYGRTAELCANSANQPDHFVWIDPKGLAAMRAAAPKFGGDPKINRWVKTEILDWGLSDAVLALGDTKRMLRETIRCAMAEVAAFDPTRGSDQPQATLAPPPLAQAREVACSAQTPVQRPDVEFVLVSHSLGSFMLLDTFAAATGQLAAAERRDDPASGADLCAPKAANAQTPASAQSTPAEIRSRYAGLCFVVANSGQILFLANQIPLLEMARLEHPQGASEDTLGQWADLVRDQSHQTLQITAFSDPGDDLSFRAPCIDKAVVQNVQVHNATHWFNELVDPGKAHLGYLHNPVVLAALFPPPGKPPATGEVCHVPPGD